MMIAHNIFFISIHKYICNLSVTVNIWSVFHLYVFTSVSNIRGQPLIHSRTRNMWRTNVSLLFLNSNSPTYHAIRQYNVAAYCLLAPPSEHMPLGHVWSAKAQISLRDAQSDQGLRCPLTYSFDIIECINGEQMPGWDFAHARDESESVHFAHVWRHRFAWRGPYIKMLLNRHQSDTIKSIYFFL